MRLCFAWSLEEFRYCMVLRAHVGWESKKSIQTETYPLSCKRYIKKKCPVWWSCFFLAIIVLWKPQLRIWSISCRLCGRHGMQPLGAKVWRSLNTSFGWVLAGVVVAFLTCHAKAFPCCCNYLMVSPNPNIPLIRTYPCPRPRYL